MLELQALPRQPPIQDGFHVVQGGGLFDDQAGSLAGREVRRIVEQALLDLDLDLAQKVLAEADVAGGRGELDPLPTPRAAVVEVYFDAARCNWADTAAPL
ncbi:hypothetical protein D3C71_1433100 [compost metagenome]